MECLQQVDWTFLPGAVADTSVCKVVDAAFATSCVDMSDWWRQLPAHVVQFICEVKSAWPLKAEHWEKLLSDDPDWPFISRVLMHGVALVHPSRIPPKVVCSNYKSYVANMSACQEVMLSELSRGLIKNAPAWFNAQWVHPLGAVAKKNGGVRIIHDCSVPKGKSLNDSQSYLYLPWASIDHILQHVSPGCYMAGIDIKEYYRNFGVDPACWPLQCFALGSGMVMIDSRLQFGHRMAPEVASRMSAALVRALQRRHEVAVVGVMDDFTLISDSSAECLRAWQGACADLQGLNLVLSEGPGKTEPPAQVKVCLGLSIDSVSMSVSLCPTKLAKLAEVCSAILAQKSVTKKQLECLLGYLMWVSRVVYAGRTFCHNLRCAMLKLRRPHHRVRVSAWLRSELLWWLHVAPSLNGAQQILPAVPVKWSEFQTDASLTGDQGMPCVGIWLQGAYVSLGFFELHQLFDVEFADVPSPSAHISIWEMYAIIVCVRLFGEYLADQYWRVRTDNSQVVSWFMKGDAPPLAVSTWMKEIASMSVHHRFRIGAKHIPGAANCMADALSRRCWLEVDRLLSRWKTCNSDRWL